MSFAPPAGGVDVQVSFVVRDVLVAVRVDVCRRRPCGDGVAWLMLAMSAASAHPSAGASEQRISARLHRPRPLAQCHDAGVDGDPIALRANALMQVAAAHQRALMLLRVAHVAARPVLRTGVQRAAVA